jgi:hypothetical protein
MRFDIAFISSIHPDRVRLVLVFNTLAARLTALELLVAGFTSKVLFPSTVELNKPDAFRPGIVEMVFRPIGCLKQSIRLILTWREGDESNSTCSQAENS